MPDQEPAINRDSYSPRSVLAALALVLVLVLGGLYLLYALRDASQRQDCMMQGRTNCAPVEPATKDN